MKKTIVLLTALIMLLTVPVIVSAGQTSYSLYVNGQKVKVDKSPKIIQKIPYLSKEDVSKQLGYKVEWEKNNRKMKVSHAKSFVQMQVVDQADAVTGTFEGLPFEADGTVYVPLKQLSDNFPMKVLWDRLSKSVYVYLSDGQASSPIFDPDPVGDPGVLVPDDLITGTVEVSQIQISGAKISIQTSKSTIVSHSELQDPNRIVLDFEDARLTGDLNSGKGGGELILDHTYIQKIRFAQNDADIVRVVFDMKKPASYQIQSVEAGKRTEISFSEKRYKIVLDAGHGGKDSGAVGLDGRYEKDFNLSVAKKIAALMEKEDQLEVVMTRKDDTFMELTARGEMANKVGADLFISIHGNNFSDSKISGIETYYWHRESFAFATLLHNNIVKASGLPDRNLRRNDWRVIKTAKMPGVLLELGYMSNAKDHALMWSEEYQNKVAKAITDGVKAYLNIK
ncbi:N-acetylmuramoyl-L-alanine amidase [Marinicrinis sediminis]|uniref:N-acetylmuramoyl-L-alanine amidase n=1 Tax=Marinicrinis sediminis TaxID=1652465 RepID=A0ABW5REY8_9BACL